MATLVDGSPVLAAFLSCWTIVLIYLQAAFALSFSFQNDKGAASYYLNLDGLMAKEKHEVAVEVADVASVLAEKAAAEILAEKAFVWLQPCLLYSTFFENRN